MALGDRINEIRKQKKMSIDTLCELSGIPKGTLSKITAGITTNPALNTVQAIAKALGCRLDDFDDVPRVYSEDLLVLPDELTYIKKYRSLDDHGKKIVDFVLSEEAERVEVAASAAKTSVYDMVEYYTPVSAGRGVMLDGTGEFFHYNVVANRYTEKADFTLRVQGHSMEPRFHDGDRLLVEEAPDVDFGEVGIFVVDGQGYVKVKGDMRLLSINPKYPGVEIDEYTYYRCVGRVIGTLDPSWVVE